MFFEVSSTKNSKKVLFGAIKNKLSTLSPKERIESPVYYIVSSYYLYLFSKEKTSVKDPSFLNEFKIVKFIKNNFSKLDKFVVFFEKEGKLNAFVKDKDKITQELDHSLEMASLLLFYERYFEEFRLFYLPSSKLDNVAESLINIYELSDSVFLKIEEEITDDDLSQIEDNVQLIDIFNKFKDKLNKPRAVDKDKQDLVLKKIKKMVKPVIYISILGGLSFGGWYYLDMQQKEREAIEKAEAAAKKVKKTVDLTIANKNFAKTETIKKYLETEKALIVTAKGGTITAMVPVPNENEKDPFKYVFKISENQFYIEGKIPTLNSVKTIRDVKPINFNVLFNEFNKKGYKQENFMIISTEVSPEEMMRLLSLINRDNIYSYDIFIKKSVIDDKYSVNMNIYKAIKKDSSKKKGKDLADFRKMKKDKVEE